MDWPAASAAFDAETPLLALEMRPNNKPALAGAATEDATATGPAAGPNEKLELEGAAAVAELTGAGGAAGEPKEKAPEAFSGSAAFSFAGSASAGVFCSAVIDAETPVLALELRPNENPALAGAATEDATATGPAAGPNEKLSELEGAATRAKGLPAVCLETNGWVGCVGRNGLLVACAAAANGLLNGWPTSIRIRSRRAGPGTAAPGA